MRLEGSFPYFSKRSCDLEIEGDVHGAGGMGDCADGDVIDAGFSDGADGFQIDAATRFGFGAARDNLDGLAQLGSRHVVEEDDVSAGVGRLARLLEGVGFDLNLKFGIFRAGGEDRDVDGIGMGSLENREMVVFDQDHVVETEAMILSAATSNRVFFELAPTGKGFARVENAGLSSRGEIDEAAGGGRDAAEVLDEIEGDTFGFQNGAGVAANGKKGGAFFKFGAVGGGLFEAERVAPFFEGHTREVESRDDERFARDHVRASHGIGGNDAIGGRVARAQILLQRGPHGLAKFFQLSQFSRHKYSRFRQKMKRD